MWGRCCDSIAQTSGRIRLCGLRSFGDGQANDFHSHTATSGVRGDRLEKLCNKVLAEPDSIKTLDLNSRVMIADRLRAHHQRTGDREARFTFVMRQVADLNTTELRKLDPICMCKYFRVISSPGCVVEISGKLDIFIREAQTTGRIESFSAMDLSEILHSLITIPADELTPDSLRGIESFAHSLFREFVGRALSIKVVIEPIKRTDPQSLTIQALSNIGYAFSKLKERLPKGVPERFTREIGESLTTIIADHCSKDALQSAQPFHLVSLTRTIISCSDDVFENETKCLSRIFTALLRKKSTVDMSALREVVDNLEYRYRNERAPLNTFPRSIKAKFQA